MDIEISFLSFKLQTTMSVTEHVFVDKGIIFIAEPIVLCGLSPRHIGFLAVLTHLQINRYVMINTCQNQSFHFLNIDLSTSCIIEIVL